MVLPVRLSFCQGMMPRAHNGHCLGMGHYHRPLVKWWVAREIISVWRATGKLSRYRTCHAPCYSRIIPMLILIDRDLLLKSCFSLINRFCHVTMGNQKSAVGRYR